MLDGCFGEVGGVAWSWGACGKGMMGRWGVWEIFVEETLEMLERECDGEDYDVRCCSSRIGMVNMKKMLV